MQAFLGLKNHISAQLHINEVTHCLKPAGVSIALSTNILNIGILCMRVIFWGVGEFLETL